MNHGKLRQQLDAWIQESISASHFLIGLYRRLGDDKQAAIAFEVYESACQRARTILLNIHQTEHPFEGLEETEAEAKAWENLVKVQAGLCAYHALIVQGSGTKAGPWNRNRLERCYRRSLRGLQIAFPEAISNACHQRAIQEVSMRCAMWVLEDLQQEGSDLQRETICHSIRQSIMEEFFPPKVNLETASKKA